MTFGHLSHRPPFRRLLPYFRESLPRVLVPAVILYVLVGFKIGLMVSQHVAYAGKCEPTRAFIAVHGHL